MYVSDAGFLYTSGKPAAAAAPPKTPAGPAPAPVSSNSGMVSSLSDSVPDPGAEPGPAAEPPAASAVSEVEALSSS
ncbi:Protein of unknown function, partial [Gryllus bimaculatus]